MLESERRAARRFVHWSLARESWAVSARRRWLEIGWGDADKKAQAAVKAEREQKRKNLDKATGATGGPAGYREVGCGTVNLFDAEAAAILAVRWREDRASWR